MSSINLVGPPLSRTSRSSRARRRDRDGEGRFFAVVLAGGGIKGGNQYGNTGDFSYNIVENAVQARNLHATALHRLGIDHERLH